MVWHKVAHLCKIIRLRVACYLFYACKMHLLDLSEFTDVCSCSICPQLLQKLYQKPLKNRQ